METRVVSFAKVEDAPRWTVLYRSATRDQLCAMDVHTGDDLATLLRRHRLALGLTQEELAEQAHFSARGISDLERGVTTHPRKDTLQLLIDALHLTDEEGAELVAAVRVLRATRDPSTTHPHGRVTGPRHGSLTPWHRRPLRLPVTARQQVRLGTMFAVAALLVIVVSAGVVGRRFIPSLDGGSVQPVPRGQFTPWGVAPSNRANVTMRVINPLRATVDHQGNIYVTEGSNLLATDIPRSHVDILKLSPSGQILKRFGHFGSRRGELNQPAGVVVDPHGNIYVADYGNDRVQKFSPAGRVLAVWGSFGTKPGQFDLPEGITLDSIGNVYVTDTVNNRVQKLSPSGKPLAVWGGVCGTRPGVFCSPTDVTVGPSDHVYVVDSLNNRIQILSSSGHVLGSWTLPADDPNWPLAVAVDTRGNAYVAHSYNVVSKYTSSGQRLSSWTVGPSDAQLAVTGLAVDSSEHPMAVSGNRIYGRSADGQTFKPLATRFPPTPARFDHPSLLAVDRKLAVYVVTGSSDDQLQKLSSSGRRIRVWSEGTFDPGRRYGRYDFAGLVVDNRDNVYLSDVLSGHLLKVSPTGKVVQRWGREGSGPGQFETPYGLTLDSHGHIYVADAGNNRIQKLSPDGRPLQQWGASGTVPGQFNMPRAVVVDAQGNLYVADTGNHRIQKLSSTGKPLDVWGPTLPGGHFLKDVTSLALDPHGNVYAVDTPDNQVTELSPDGTVVAHWGATGARPGQFRNPQAVVTDHHGTVYVSDSGNSRIQWLSAAG
jgi:tripartite motif-containing protein 71